MEKLTADYVIIGSGAVGMAFADTILSESDATIIIIDRFAKPGGHWNSAYPFVQLHQPSQYYGVSSKELSQGRIEVGGLNDGLNELATGAEVSAYFDDVMRHTFLPSGRVKYFPLCDYQGDGKFISKVSGKAFHATADKKMVDATFLKTSVPSTHKPNFEIADGVRFVPLNDLPTLTEPPEGYIVIGAGKTGVDACLWLLEHGVDPDDIRWIMPRDSWFLDRANTQPTDKFFHNTMGAQAGQFESIAQATSVEDMFDRLEDCGYFIRIDPDVRPKMFHGATMSKAEIKALQQIKGIVRMGRVSSIGRSEIMLADGIIPTTPNTLHVDCSASALKALEPKPVFNGDLITPQMVRPYQPVFSAALIAHVELNYDGDEKKNELATPVPLPNNDTDFLFFTAAGMMNQYIWGQHKEIGQWMLSNRLDGFSNMIARMGDDEDKKAVLRRIRQNAMPAAMKLNQLKEGLKYSADV